MKTIKCEEIERLIVEYIDGMLKLEYKDILLSHVSQCEKCNNYLKELKKIRFYINSLKVKEPYYLESKIMAKIREQEHIQERTKVFDLGFIFKPALSFAVSLLIIIGSIFLIYNTTGDSKLSSINLPEKSIEKIKINEKNNFSKGEDIKISKAEIKDINITKEEVVNKEVEIKVTENTSKVNQIKAQTKDFIKSDEPKYSLSKVDGISLKAAKEIATPSTTNPLLERDKAIIGNNMINPLKGEFCIIKIKVDESSRVRIIIYDKRIKVVANLIDEQKEPGVYEVKWYGRNSAGDILSEGVYFVYIQIGSNVIKKNVIIVK